MKDQYCYPVIFEYAEDGVNISFPDLPGALICGDTTEEALEMAKTIHPNWDAPGMRAKNNWGRELHARNCYQVLGRGLNNPSKFLLCWTEGGKAVGGTRTAIKLAERYDVPILNFGSCNENNYMEAFELFYMRYGNS